MLEEIAKEIVMWQVIERAKKIANFFCQSYRLVLIMKKYTCNHELLWPDITRFATHFIANESIYKYRGGLFQLIKSDEWLELK